MKTNDKNIANLRVLGAFFQAEQSDECATMAGAWPTSDAFAFPSISRLISKRI